MNTPLHAQDRYFMQLALQEGRKALPACLPNPPVGCVLVRNGQVIAAGHTQAPGQPHAEALAIQQLDGDLSDVTAYVTLEPCSFHGRTPSCAKSLVERKLWRAVVAMVDPDPRNDGKGLDILQLGGVAVTLGVCEDQALADLSTHLNRPDNH